MAVGFQLSAVSKKQVGFQQSVSMVLKSGKFSLIWPELAWQSALQSAETVTLP
jgi:hypothetical protein